MTWPVGARPRNKYGARPARGLLTGRRFDSTAERDRGEELAALAVLGEIRALVFQPRLELEPSVYYKPDFSYERRDGDGWRLLYEEVKGVEDGRFRLLRKLWRLHGPAPLVILKRTGRAVAWQTEQITPTRTNWRGLAAQLRAELVRMAEADRRTPTMRSEALEAVTAYDLAAAE